MQQCCCSCRKKVHIWNMSTCTVFISKHFDFEGYNVRDKICMVTLYCYCSTPFVINFNSDQLKQMPTSNWKWWIIVSPSFEKVNLLTYHHSSLRSHITYNNDGQWIHQALNWACQEHNTSLFPLRLHYVRPKTKIWFC